MEPKKLGSGLFVRLIIMKSDRYFKRLKYLQMNNNTCYLVYVHALIEE